MEQFHLASALLHDLNGSSVPVLDETGQPVEKDPFHKYADKMEFIKNWYIARISGETSLAPNEFEQRLFPEVWSSLAGGDNQFLDRSPSAGELAH